MKKIVLLICIFFLINQMLFSKDKDNLSISTFPYAAVPLGSSTDIFKSGIGIDGSAAFIPDLFKYYGLMGGANYLNLSLQSDSSINILTGYAGPVFRLPLNERISVFANGKIGYYYWNPAEWDADGDNGGGLALGGGAGAFFRISGPFTIGAAVSYDYYSELYNGLNINISLNLDFPGLEKETLKIKLDNFRLLPLFPVLYGYYDNNPLGTVSVINTGKKTAENISISLFVERYMDNPMEISKPFNIEPEEEKLIDLYALFTEELMEITEGTKVSAKITVSQGLGSNYLSRDYTTILEFYNRNALSWDDDRKIASFVTAKDPEIMNFSKNIVSWMKEVKNPAVDDNLQKGMAVFEALKLYGIHYEIDPSTPFSKYSEEATAVDFIQFPRQTLQYTNGDCDDLTALYISLLESVGVETAFITIPGHIYAAFALKSSPEEAEKTFSKKDDLIIENGRVWLPVEITMFQNSFDKAWQSGAKEWRESKQENQAELYPVMEAWDLFPAVGFGENTTNIRLPDRQVLRASFSDSINRHIEKEIFPQVQRLKQRIEQGQQKSKFQNRLGVIYARFGLYDKAVENFQKVLNREEYIPALNNLGNILFLKSEYEEAMQFFNKALYQG